jgi:hypothetical protein
MLFPDTGPEFWATTQGRVEVRSARGGADVDLNLFLSRLYPEARVFDGAARDDESIRISKRAVTLDIGTAIHCFKPTYIEHALELRYWLSEDPGLDVLLPQQTLGWRLTRRVE